MAKKKNSPFDETLTSIYGNPTTTDEATNMDRLGVVSPLNVDDEDDNKPVGEGTQPTEDNKGTQSDPNAREDDSEIPESVLNNINNNIPPANEDHSNEEGEDNTPDPNEAQHVGAFFDAFAEALNWNVDDDDKPTTVEGIIDYMKDVVEQNSKPEYADDRIAQLDQYVKNGGRFEDFYSIQSQRQSYDTLDMEDESNLKAVVRDYMKMLGYTDEQINRKIERYEDNDMLEDEANDAVAYLKRVREQQLAVAQAEQEEAMRRDEARATKFFTDLTSSIKNLSSIRGISVPKEDRAALYDYITKVGADGLTQYQKDFNGNMVNNLIESAYFTMKGDALLDTAARNGQTSAANKLRDVLKHLGKNHSSRAAQEEKAPQAWEIASKFLG